MDGMTELGHFGDERLQKGGADAAKVIEDFLPLVKHMHLKDYLGGPEWAGDRACILASGHRRSTLRHARPSSRGEAARPWRFNPR